MLEWYLEDVQEKIGYRFKNIALLRQAFISPSVTEASYNRVQNYQVLEFIGDAVLSFAVVKEMAEKQCRIDEAGQLVCDAGEGKLSVQKQDLVKNETLSHCSDMLGFNSYIERFYGHYARDSKNKRGDLIESIMGALALDCLWDSQVIASAARRLLRYKNFPVNYEDKLRRICYKKKFAEPEFVITHGQKKSALVACTVEIKELNRVFRGNGDDELEARQRAAKAACGCFDKKENVSPLILLNNFCDQKKIAKPKYCFTLRDDGTQKQWTCEATLGGTGFCERASAKTKLEAKRLSAAALLSRVESEEFAEVAGEMGAVRGHGLLLLAESLSPR